MTETLTSALAQLREDDVLATVRAAKEAGKPQADVIAALQAGMTPEQVFEHCKKLVRDIGPTGYIPQSSCDIPVDAPLATVKAMADAADAAAG